MPDIKSIFERQSAWQRQRAKRPWADKIRQAVLLRDTQRALRNSSPKPSRGSS